ncbi:hypothetical protein [Streptomyces sp. MBT53]|uniref:hypothetical protein n=1 Tax=Streptomyces sp. MBT53 TaxID=1488384 RepID=UPI001912C0EC|nr:hypothetical protein [Streptomyces sp. MBT53]MBK6017007.1 hypothetical protein [Streptomyces sp. MBT53]
MSDNRETVTLLRSWLTSARWGLIDALVALELAEEDRQEKAKRQLRNSLLSLDEFRNCTTFEEYRG